MENYLKKMVANGIFKHVDPSRRRGLVIPQNKNNQFLTLISNKFHVSVCIKRFLTLWGPVNPLRLTKARGIFSWKNHFCIHMILHLSSFKYLRSAYYVPGTDPGAKGTRMNLAKFLLSWSLPHNFGPSFHPTTPAHPQIRLKCNHPVCLRLDD